jgi:hypothetical protein
MFITFKQRLFLGMYIIIILSIPVVSYLLSQNQNPNVAADEPLKPLPSSATITQAPPATATPSASIAPKKSILDQLEEADQGALNQSSVAQPYPQSASAVSFGPTLNLYLNIEGRPTNNQASKVFLGIVDNTSSANNPKFLLSFTVDVPSTGSFSGISLAGLNSGQSYRAYIKGPSQIATSSAFVMSPTVTVLNSGSPITLLSGDLNEDNTINSSDFSLLSQAYGARIGSNKWNENFDLNKDGVINGLDSAIIIKNFGKVGDSGAWQSTPAVGSEMNATSSADFLPPPKSKSAGYWIWVPQ